jgi:hypothetical protein
MGDSFKDRLAVALVNELFDRIASASAEALREQPDGAEPDDRDETALDRASWAPDDRERAEIECSISSARALIDRWDRAGGDTRIAAELEQRVHHARGVLANAFLALYGGFGRRGVIEA